MEQLVISGKNDFVTALTLLIQRIGNSEAALSRFQSKLLGVNETFSLVDESARQLVTGTPTASHHSDLQRHATIRYHIL